MIVYHVYHSLIFADKAKTITSSTLSPPPNSRIDLSIDTLTLCSKCNTQITKKLWPSTQSSTTEGVVNSQHPNPIPTFQFTMGLGTTLPLLITTCILPLHGKLVQRCSVLIVLRPLEVILVTTDIRNINISLPRLVTPQT